MKMIFSTEKFTKIRLIKISFCCFLNLNFLGVSSSPFPARIPNELAFSEKDTFSFGHPELTHLASSPNCDHIDPVDHDSLYEIFHDKNLLEGSDVAQPTIKTDLFHQSSDYSTGPSSTPNQNYNHNNEAWAYGNSPVNILSKSNTMDSYHYDLHENSHDKSLLSSFDTARPTTKTNSYHQSMDYSPGFSSAHNLNHNHNNEVWASENSQKNNPIGSNSFDSVYHYDFNKYSPSDNFFENSDIFQPTTKTNYFHQPTDYPQGSSSAHNLNYNHVNEAGVFEHLPEDHFFESNALDSEYFYDLYENSHSNSFSKSPDVFQSTTNSNFPHPSMDHSPGPSSTQNQNYIHNNEAWTSGNFPENNLFKSQVDSFKSPSIPAKLPGRSNSDEKISQKGSFDEGNWTMDSISRFLLDEDPSFDEKLMIFDTSFPKSGSDHIFDSKKLNGVKDYNGNTELKDSIFIHDPHHQPGGDHEILMNDVLRPQGTDEYFNFQKNEIGQNSSKMNMDKKRLNISPPEEGYLYNDYEKIIDHQPIDIIKDKIIAKDHMLHSTSLPQISEKKNKDVSFIELAFTLPEEELERIMNPNNFLTYEKNPENNLNDQSEINSENNIIKKAKEPDYYRDNKNMEIIGEPSEKKNHLNGLYKENLIDLTNDSGDDSTESRKRPRALIKKLLDQTEIERNKKFRNIKIESQL
ncbi:hypothetical protein BY996DRAFT_6414421 [Phakopsora pachyrhizi]|uniref:Expressed protein n=1 Tax=Phakopsora pachyrhizi TaxID=170000 RepID=A0AAV0B1Z9_PHAPC|nr:hypothetical protein BY996DRAFT_6422681 [Phakopsora pachyrhizi]KAI8453758.1 hypothetical protein BY996DRAFT_6414421 [Phakopsora pachyrhizi]CAH7677474.1 expressed protein [Phakopsora pachyrhizi]CAH7681656.1 expressed protein [Phakopsora pachyrhizi]